MPLPFARTASQTRPTFSRDFAGLKTLDHGVGPAITFTRGSDATYFNAAGTLTTATTNEPRFDHSIGLRGAILGASHRGGQNQQNADELVACYWRTKRKRSCYWNRGWHVVCRYSACRNNNRVIDWY